MVVTGRAHRAAVEEQLPELADPNVVLESEPRDSSAAIGLAAAILERREPGVIIGSFAADHVIRDSRGFRRAVAEARRRRRRRLHRHDRHHARPSRRSASATSTPASRSSIDGRRRARSSSTPSSRSPTSRPPSATSPTASYLWNAGMFIARADVLLEQLGESEPELLAGPHRARRGLGHPAPRRRRRPGLAEPRRRSPSTTPSPSRPPPPGELAVIPGDFDWDDVGDFASIAKLHSGGRKSDLAILGENARVLADSSSGVVVSQSGRAHLADRRRPTSSSSTPRMRCS